MNENIRICEINGIMYASIKDMLSTLTNLNVNYVWTQLKQQFPIIHDMYINFKLPGAKRTTPIANYENLINIIQFLHH